MVETCTHVVHITYLHSMYVYYIVDMCRNASLCSEKIMHRKWDIISINFIPFIFILFIHFYLFASYDFISIIIIMAAHSVVEFAVFDKHTYDTFPLLTN